MATTERGNSVPECCATLAEEAAMFMEQRDDARAEVKRLQARLALLERRTHPMDFDSPAYD